MTIVDLLSDTVYRDKARKRIDTLLDEIRKFPVKTAQIYGLRQIARQQPLRVKEFAEHQRTRAEQKNRQSEVQFWQLVERLCDSRNGWSVCVEGDKHAPPELREENIPPRRSGMTDDERRNRNQLRQRQRKWNDSWTVTHVPAFFERFCTHALYRLKMSETNHGDRQI